MPDHQLSKQGDRWVCSLCLLSWKSKPRTDCAGVPVYRYYDRPAHLLTEDELTAQNLKPTGEPVATMRVLNAPYYIDLYDRAQTEVAIPDLPPISDCSERFAQLKNIYQLQRWNLKPGNAKPQGCYWGWRNSEWVYLYRREDCEVDDPNLPPCFDKEELPADLKTREDLEQLNLTPGEAQPRGCHRYWSKYNGWVTVLLWHPDDCQWQAQDNYICKTTLRQTYLLSDRWIQRIGNPDLVTDNPHHEKWNAMKLYSRQRVEAFLAANAEEYARWLDERNHYIQIFEANREAIAAGRARARAEREQAYQEQRQQRELEREAQRQERWRQQEQELAELEMTDPVRAQTIRCLQCASGCATQQGFLCAIHPTGLESHQVPCPDWTERRMG